MSVSTDSLLALVTPPSSLPLHVLLALIFVTAKPTTKIMKISCILNNLLKSRFCHIHVKEPICYCHLIVSYIGEISLQFRSTQSIAGRPLLRALIRICMLGLIQVHQTDSCVVQGNAMCVHSNALDHNFYACSTIVSKHVTCFNLGKWLTLWQSLSIIH